jgi:hypothetical protein
MFAHVTVHKSPQFWQKIETEIFEKAEACLRHKPYFMCITLSNLGGIFLSDIHIGALYRPVYCLSVKLSHEYYFAAIE